MIDVEETPTFSRWLDVLRDPIAKAKIVSRIRRLAFGNFGDVAPIGDGLSEMRIHYGPGYRVYFMQKGTHFVLLLGGGDKSTQDKDIHRARTLAKDLRL
jgi:putative addiction module killer protein